MMEGHWKWAGHGRDIDGRGMGGTLGWVRHGGTLVVGGALGGHWWWVGHWGDPGGGWGIGGTLMMGGDIGSGQGMGETLMGGAWEGHWDG